jgi:hypothetical protein
LHFEPCRWHHRPRPVPGPRIAQADRSHRPEPRHLRPALRDDLGSACSSRSPAAPRIVRETRTSPTWDERAAQGRLPMAEGSRLRMAEGSRLRMAEGSRLRMAEALGDGACTSPTWDEFAAPGPRLRMAGPVAEATAAVPVPRGTSLRRLVLGCGWRIITSHIEVTRAPRSAARADRATSATSGQLLWIDGVRSSECSGEPRTGLMDSGSAGDPRAAARSSGPTPGSPASRHCPQS